MGRKSSLTEKQWSEIERRLVKGEAARVLAREFGISEAANDPLQRFFYVSIKGRPGNLAAFLLPQADAARRNGRTATDRADARKD